MSTEIEIERKEKLGKTIEQLVHASRHDIDYLGLALRMLVVHATTLATSHKDPRQRRAWNAVAVRLTKLANQIDARNFVGKIPDGF
jgi:hypothetical protein